MGIEREQVRIKRNSPGVVDRRIQSLYPDDGQETATEQLLFITGASPVDLADHLKLPYSTVSDWLDGKGLLTGRPISNVEIALRQLCLSKHGMSLDDTLYQLLKETDASTKQVAQRLNLNYHTVWSYLDNRQLPTGMGRSIVKQVILNKYPDIPYSIIVNRLSREERSLVTRGLGLCRGTVDCFFQKRQLVLGKGEEIIVTHKQGNETFEQTFNRIVLSCGGNPLIAAAQLQIDATDLFFYFLEMEDRIDEIMKKQSEIPKKGNGDKTYRKRVIAVLTDFSLHLEDGWLPLDVFIRILDEDDDGLLDQAETLVGVWRSLRKTSDPTKVTLACGYTDIDNLRLIWSRETNKIFRERPDIYKKTVDAFQSRGLLE